MFEVDFPTATATAANVGTSNNNHTENIINNWLNRSNLLPISLQNSQPGSRTYEFSTKLEDILLEGDSVIESFIQNPDGNIAKQLEEYYEKRAEESTSDALYPNEMATLFLEENSIWKLANALYSDRCQRETSNNNEDLDNVPLLFPTTTDFQLVQYLLSNSDKMADAAIVRNWLEGTAPNFQPIAPRKGGWVLTQAEIKNNSRQLKQKSNNLVTELDPDAVYRQDKSLVLEDEQFENNLLRTLYFFIRRGKIEEAITLVSSSDQSWRAASIRGGLYFRDPKLELNDDEGMSYDFDPEDDANTVMGDDFSDVPAGNLNRFLWKSTCYMISKESKNPKYERALYAILCGDLDSLLEVCETWEDYLWAYYNCLMESRIEKFFRKCGRTSETTGLPSPPLLDISEKDIFEYLEQSPNSNVYSQASNDYSQIKKHMILGSLDELIDNIHSKLLPSFSETEKCEVDFRVVRTLSLLILFLRSIGFLGSLSSADKIIQVYISRLVDLKQFRFAILYCSKLSNGIQADIYANLLSNINDTLEVRLECLRYGSMYGLNFDRVLLVAAEKSLEDAARKDPILENLDPESFIFNSWCKEVPESVQLQVRSFEWINHETSFYADSIILCNSACRRFLKTGRVWAANILLEAMPQDFVLPEWKADIEDGTSATETLLCAIREYLNYNLLVDAFKRLDHWNSLMHNKPSEASSEFPDWEIRIKESTNDTEISLREVLTCDWMYNCFSPNSSKHPEDFTKKEFRKEATYLRRLYLPEIIFKLYDVLIQTCDIIPENLSKAFDFSELVASEKYGLYKDLMMRPNANGTYNALPLFLEKMQEAGTLLLKKAPLSKNSCFFPDESNLNLC